MQNTVPGAVGKEPALFKTVKQVLTGKGHNGRELPILISVRIQIAAAAQILHGVEDLVLRISPVILTFGIVPELPLHVHQHLLLLHELHIRRAKGHQFPKVIAPSPAAHHLPEERRDFVKKCGVEVIAFPKGRNGLFIEKAPQGLSGDNVPAAADQVQNAAVIGIFLRRSHIQFLHKPLIPLFFSRNKNNATFSLELTLPAIPTQAFHLFWVTDITPAPVEPGPVQQRFALARPHGGIHNMKG